MACCAGSARSGPPVPEVICVESDAEEICGNESELCGSHPNDANHNAICRCNNPSLPQSLSQEHRGKDGQNTGHVVEPKHSLIPESQDRPLLSGLHFQFRKLRRGGKLAEGSGAAYVALRLGTQIGSSRHRRAWDTQLAGHQHVGNARKFRLSSAPRGCNHYPAIREALAKRSDSPALGSKVANLRELSAGLRT